MTILYYTFSIATIGFGIYLNRRGRHLRKQGKKTMAVVIKNNMKGTSKGVAYSPVVQFSTEKNETVTQELHVAYNPAKPEGMKLEILYDPLNPTVVEVNSTFTLRVLPKLVIVVGLLFLLVAVANGLS